ncbi:MAG: thioredoxin fold domain-containing protein [Candidatus Omnitrophica bacterium]|nr:thioredoxin fold domain-containing protein [Candidatus Omnitrophota bacterium]
MKNLIGLMILSFIFASCQQVSMMSKSIWKPYSEKVLADSVNRKKPVVIDFYADWCPNCHELDRTVFSDPAIAAKLASVTALRMDVTDMDNSRVQRIIQEYGIDGVPTIVFLDSHGHEIPDSRIVGVVSSKEFSQALALLAIFK